MTRLACIDAALSCYSYREDVPGDNGNLSDMAQVVADLKLRAADRGIDWGLVLSTAEFVHLVRQEPPEPVIMGLWEGGTPAQVMGVFRAQLPQGARLILASCEYDEPGNPWEWGILFVLFELDQKLWRVCPHLILGRPDLAEWWHPVPVRLRLLAVELETGYWDKYAFSGVLKKVLPQWVGIIKGD